MLELGNNSFANMLAFFIVLSFISCEGVQYRNAAPFGAFVQGNKQFAEDRGRDREDSLF